LANKSLETVDLGLIRSKKAQFKEKRDKDASELTNRQKPTA